MSITKKKIMFSCLFIAIIVCMGLILSSCFLRDSSKNTRSVLDVYSRDVTYPKDVNRIATVGSATRMVVYAGAQDKLVAITDMDKPSELRPYTLVNPELFASLPSTNNGNQYNDISINKEAMLEAKPDVIFSSRSAEECDKLQNELKIPVIGVLGTEDLTNDLSYKPLLIIGEVTGSEDKAYKTVGYIRNVVNIVLTARSDNQIKMYRGAINFKGSKDLTGTYSNYCIYKILKSINVADNPEIDGAYDTNLEQILQ